MKIICITLLIGGFLITSCKSPRKENSNINKEEQIIDITTKVEKDDRNINLKKEITTLQNSSIEWRRIKIETVEEINKKNDSIIDTEKKPNIKESKLVFRVISSPDLHQSMPQEWIEISKKQVTNYINEYQITDNQYKSKRFALIKENENYFVREFLTEVGYYYGEEAGVRKRVAIIGKDKIKSENIFLMFSEDYNFPQGKIDLFEIKNHDENRILPENEIIYKDSCENLSFRHSGILCKGTFQFKGTGTISPTYINVKLVVVDLKTGIEQELYKLPYTFYEGLRKIVLCDINGDNYKDIVLEVEDELSGHRLLFLTNFKDTKVVYDFIGIMETYRDDP
jgi:predicted protein tyrosine phosphatase